MTGRKPGRRVVGKAAPVRPASYSDEKAWQADIVDTATRLGWQLRYHTFDSRRSTPGFPDLVLCRAPRLIFAELKSDNGRVTPDQWQWIDELGSCGPPEAYVWRPEIRDTVDRILAGRARHVGP